jgi:hypothetical protein
MAFLEVIHRNHQWQPDLLDGGFGHAAFVEQPGKMLRLKSRDPGIDGRTRDMQEPADADFFPALRVEFDHLQAGLVAVRLGM